MNKLNIYEDCIFCSSFGHKALKCSNPYECTVLYFSNLLIFITCFAHKYNKYLFFWFDIKVIHLLFYLLMTFLSKVKEIKQIKCFNLMEAI